MVTVIIPVFNTAGYLAECLDSVGSQRCDEPIEIIIVDDGSTDNSLSVAQRWAEGRSNVRIITQANAGQAVARNVGIDAARGQWLMFVDSDDVLHPLFIHTLLNLSKQTNAEIACCRFTRRQADLAEGSNKIRVYNPLEAIRLTLLQVAGTDNCPWGKLYARRLFDDVKFRQGILYEDLDLFYRLYERANAVAMTDARLYYYRKTPGSSMAKWSPGLEAVLDVCRRIVDWAPAPLQRAAKIRLFAAGCTVLARAEAHSPRIDQAWQAIKQNRKSALTAPRARWRDRAGALLSFAGKKASRAIFRRVI